MADLTDMFIALRNGIIRRLATLNQMHPDAFMTKVFKSFAEREINLTSTDWIKVGKYKNRLFEARAIVYIDRFLSRVTRRGRIYVLLQLTDVERTYTKSKVTSIVGQKNIYRNMLNMYTYLRGDVEEGTTFFDDEENIHGQN